VASATAGYGVIQLMPSMRGIETAIRRQLAAPTVTRAASDAGERLGGSLADGLGRAGTAVRSAGTALTVGVTAPITALGVNVVRTAGNFQASMNRVKAISGATGTEFKQLTNLAKDLGSTTQFSASEAADALGFLSMAGFSATDSMTALPGVLNLAAAGQLGLADAADIASNILSGYGFQAKDISRVNDVLAKTFTSANVDTRMLGESFKYVGPVAASAKLEFEEVSAAIGLLGNAGIQGSEAGTALRGSIARLLKPTGEVEETLKKLGVRVTDTRGELLPLVDIVGQLEKAGASTADMMTIFGLEAGPAMTALVSQGSGALRTLTQDLRDSGGTAEHIATVQMEGFNGALASLKSAWEGLLIAVGDSGLLDWATDLVDRLTGLVGILSETDSGLVQLGTQILIAAAVVGPVLGAIGVGLTVAGTGLSLLLTPLGLVAAGALVLGGAFVAVAAMGGPLLDVLTGLAGDALEWATGAALDLKDAAADSLLPALKDMGGVVVDNVLPPMAALGGLIRSDVLPLMRDAAVFLAGDLLPLLIDTGAWVAKHVLPPLLGLATTVGGPLLAAIGLVVRAGMGIVRWLRGMGMWLVPIAIAVGGLTLAMSLQSLAVGATVVAFNIYRASMAIVTLVTKAATIAQAALNAVLMANPYVLIVVLIIALVAAIVLAYKRSETFRNIVQGVWEAIKKAVSVVWETVLKPVFAAIVVAVQAVADVALWLWNTVLSPTFAAIAAAAKVLFVIWAIIVFGPMVLAVKALAAIVTWLWKSIFSPVFAAIAVLVGLWWAGVKMYFGFVRDYVIGPLATIITWLWKSVFVPVFDGIKLLVSLWWTGVKAYFQAVRDYVIGPLGTVFTWLWENAVKPAFDGIKAVIDAVWRYGIKPVFDAIKSAIGLVADAFEIASGGIGTAWDKIKDATKTPINWVLRVVWNEGIVPAWDKITGWIPGVPKLGKLDMLEAGGPMPVRPGVFSRPVAIVGEGNPAYPEYVIPTDPKYRARALALHEQAGTQLLESGGVIGWIKDRARDVGGVIGGAAGFLADPIGSLMKLLDPILNKGRELAGTSWGQMAAGLPRMVVDGLKSLVTRGASEVSGPGPGGSAVTRWLPLVRQVLAQLGAPASAATPVLTRINIESGGNPTAINLWDSNARAGIPSQGLMQTIPSTFNAYAGPYRSRGIVDPLANIYAGVNYAMNRYGSDWIKIMTRPGGYDSGGKLPPGLSAVYNGTRRPEAVLTDQQWQAVYAAARGRDDGGGDTYNFYPRTLDMTVGDLETLQRRQEARARVGRPG
jgi:TP901 family phage tail tape measure protein